MVCARSWHPSNTVVEDTAARVKRRMHLINYRLWDKEGKGISRQLVGERP